MSSKVNGISYTTIKESNSGELDQWDTPLNERTPLTGGITPVNHYTASQNEFKAPDKADDVQVDFVADRESWGHKSEFLLASIGLAVGLGNIWRFPYLCQKNGGGAFLIPYLTMMLLEGIPLFYIEFAVGQRFRKSAVGCWRRIHPALAGIGFSAMVVSSMMCIYYIVVMAWSFYYLFVSLTKSLPWKLQSCPRYEEFNELSNLCSNTSNPGHWESCLKKNNFSECCVHDPQLYYFYRRALDVSPSIDDFGNGMNWKIVGCLVLSWVAVFACIVKGVKSSGKAVYFTATFPYVILVILFFVGVTLDGASIGLKKLFKPDFSALANPSIWMDAAIQMFFSLSVGFGALISFASYMPIKNNCVRDAYTVVLIDFATSIFAGVVVFSILGHREYTLGKPADKVGGGPGLAFITFADAFLQMPVSPLWSALFFFMLVLLGIDSEFGTLEGLIAPFYDNKWIKLRKDIFTGLCCVAMLLLGLGLVCSSGYYSFQMFDDFSLSLPLLFIAFVQTIAVSWVYGTERLGDDVEYMTGKRPYLIWMICWKYLSPLALIIIFVSNLVKLAKESPKYSVYVGCIQQLVDFSPHGTGASESTRLVSYPGWAMFFIAVFILVPMTPILYFLVLDLVRNPRKWREGFISTFTNWHNFLPDPSSIDPSRRRTVKDIEMEIKREMEEDIKE